MVDIMDRRVTRSLSNELAARQVAAAASQQAAASHSFAVQSSYHAHSYHQQHHNSSVGQGYQPHVGQGYQHQHQHQEPSNGGINHHHHQHQHQHQHQQQQQQTPGGMNGGGLRSSIGTYPRTTSDEIFLNTLMNTPLSPGTPTMDAASLGFLDILQAQPTVPSTQLRGNSEELFNSWLTTIPENSPQPQNSVYFGPSTNGNRPRQNSRRMSSELQATIAQQNGTPWARRADNVEQAYKQTNSYLADDIMSNVNHGEHNTYRPNPSEEKSAHPADPYSNASSVKNMWFNASSPMTRSRSSELRRRYAQMEGLPAPPSAGGVFQKLTIQQGTLEGLLNPVLTSMEPFTREVRAIGKSERHQNNPDSNPMGPQAPHVPTLTPAPVNNRHQQIQQQQSQQQPVQQQLPAVTNVLTDVVGLLKGSLERKKLQTKHQHQMPPQQQQQQTAQQRQMPQQQQQEPQPGVRVQQEESLDKPQEHRQHVHHSENGMAQSGQAQQQNGGMMPVYSPDESSCGAPAPSHSAGIATSDGPSNSAVSVHRQALKRGSGSGAVDQPAPKRHQAFSGIDSGACSGENLENGPTKSDLLKKSDQLARAGSITSSLRTGFQLNELDGDTRKRRVERQRKMAEAKGRGNAPPVPADLQAAIKRCDALEKEVRSLKLNLSFMNRKDSEQTKKIEELEQQNDELKDERDRLLEELDQL